MMNKVQDFVTELPFGLLMLASYVFSTATVGTLVMFLADGGASWGSFFTGQLVAVFCGPMLLGMLRMFDNMY